MKRVKALKNGMIGVQTQFVNVVQVLVILLQKIKSLQGITDKFEDNTEVINELKQSGYYYEEE